MDISGVIQSFLWVALAALASVATAYVVKAWQVKAAQLSKEQWTLLNWIVSSAVWSAEQAARAGLIKKTPEAKLDYATKMIQRELDANELKGIDVERIVATCQAAVAQELNRGKLLAAPPADRPVDLPTGPQA